MLWLPERQRLLEGSNIGQGFQLALLLFVLLVTMLGPLLEEMAEHVVQLLDLGVLLVVHLLCLLVLLVDFPHDLLDVLRRRNFLLLALLGSAAALFNCQLVVLLALSY